MIYHHKNFKSELIIPRNIDVWLPETLKPGERLPVLYMHDGQNLFEPAKSPGKVDWGVDKAISRLINTGRLKGVIIVGVWSTALRVREYMPGHPMNGPSASLLLQRFIEKEGGKPLSDLYIRFLIGELKTFIDSHYPTLPDQPNTFIMGSDMGGLVSAYAVCEFPHIFAGAGCLSTHWPIGETPLIEGLGALLPPPGLHKLYFDYGTTGIDAGYEPYQLKMDAILRSKGYTSDVDWMTLKFDGAAHNEAAWQKRVHIPLEFLLVEEI
jgi:hypothetical protein